VIEVQPGPSPPVRFNGQVWIRVGPRRAIATADEERRLSERRRAGDLPFDSREAVGTTVDDLDLALFEREYLPSVLTPEVLEANDRTIGQRLASLHLTSVDGVPTNAGSATPVRLTWYTDRIEIHSPGGPYGIVRVENFGQPGVTAYRNPVLAEAMRALGYVQRFGAGLPIARRALEENGSPPAEFIADPAYVGVVVWGAK
jgi:predicted HTH transcriptional regulator